MVILDLPFKTRYRGLVELIRCGSPRTRFGSSHAQIGFAHFLSRRFAAATPKLLPAIQDDPSYPNPHRYLAACYAHMGRLDEAREIVTRLRAITSTVIPDASYLSIA